MKALVFGVIYPGVENYLQPYFNSLHNNTFNDFDLLIIEDGIELPKKYLKANTIKKKATNKTPAEIRGIGLKYAKENDYDIIIFTDTDDYFSSNRIQNCVLNINGSDFLANHLVSVNNEGKKLCKIIIPRNINFAQILDGNFFGLSNTAILTRSLPENFYIPKDLIAVDWWLFSILLLHGSNYNVDDDAITFYRQHSGNTSGYSFEITIEKIRFSIKIKLIHYNYLLKYILKNDLNSFSNLVNKKIEIFSKLEIDMKDEIFAKNYCLKLNQVYHKIKKGWWSEIIPLNELDQL